MRTRVEQLRQARRIHGGSLGMTLAALGVKLSRLPVWAIYGVVLACNLRLGLLLVTNMALGVMLAIALAVPPLPTGWLWIYLLLILASHRFQLWSHSVYTEHRDMSEFQEKYPKGLKLFFVLLLYELPILLNFFLLNEKEPKPPSGLNDRC